MVLVDADPLKDIQNLQKIHLVIKDGKAYPSEGLLQQIRSQTKKRVPN
jgi:hypothetical protein